MTVYFSNKGKIDLDVIRTMGVSVKENDNPIGYFGTGLKYAIATLLRTGHTVKLITGGREILFRDRPKEIRGKTFNIVYMDHEQLGFTTELGKNWQVWQAYRELYSNAMDELGRVSTIFEENDTVFAVSGPEIDKVHAERGEIFLIGDPWLVGDGVEVYRKSSNFIYYRGVRVGTLPSHSRFTYNITTPMLLTEDRTLASTYDLNYKLSVRLPRIANHEFALKVLDPEWEGFESDLSFPLCADPSEEFLDALEKYREDSRLSSNMRDMLLQHRKISCYETFELNEKQFEDVWKACRMLMKLNCHVTPQDFVFVENLGPGVYAKCEDGKMFITRQTIANGTDFLAITMYEEWIHDRFGYEDCSRGMQQFLFDKILELIK